MNILIFGGSGFIGQNLALHYKENGERVWLADIVYPTILELVPNYVGCDIRVPYHVKSMLYNIKPDIIINCAGQTSHPLSMANPASDADVNVLGNLVLLEEYRKICPDTLFIHLSSTTVIGPTSEPIVDFTPRNPVDIYSANKLAAETYLSVFEGVYDLNVRVLRLPNIYGPFGKNDPAYGVLNYWIGQADEGKGIKVYGEGQQTRNVLYVKDAIEAIKICHLAPRQPIFVVGTQEISMLDIANTIAEIWQVDVNCVDWPRGREKIEIGSVHIGSYSFGLVTGWEAKYSLEDGLLETKKVISDVKA